MKIGKLLSRVREESNLNQKQLAKKMKVSTSRISRMETDITPLSETEINSYLNAIGTETAREVQKYIKQKWTKITKPDFFHPSRNHLWMAETSFKQIDGLKGDIDSNSVFYKQLEMHEKTIRQLSNYLASTEHTVACIGSIGVGKTTAICGFSELKHNGKPVLHTGGGRSTVCEVHIQKGPEYGITVEPLLEDEIYKYVYAFCDYLLAITAEKDDDKKFIDAESYSLSKEIERCIRNMTGLSVKRFKSEKGFQIDDRAINLVKRLKADNSIREEDLSDEVKLQVLLKLNLENRKKTEIWYSNELAENSLKWLTKNYFEINHGRHPNFSIPRKIILNIPNAILSYDKLNIRIIDTKGVDDTAKREDLEKHLIDPRAISVFCSRFLDAPDETTKTLIERAIASGIKDRLKTETAILVLPRNEEAISVNTLDGTPIEESEEGYLVRHEDMQSDLMKYDLRDLPIYFYDERREPSDDAKKFIISRIEGLREFHEKRVEEVSRTIYKVVENITDAQAEAAFSEVLKSLTAWIVNHKKIEPIGNVHESLIETIGDKRTYAASVRASVNRYGTWDNLDYYYQIGFGTRSETVKSIAGMLAELITIIKNLQAREDLEPAHEFLKELLHFCNSEAENLYQEIQRLGQAIFKEKLHDSDKLWHYLQDQWGRGAGYKLRVSGKTQEWFNEDEQKKTHNLIQNRIAKSWEEMLSKFEDLAQGIFA
jgi:transcriptional regulator with XRE-family HTH domain